MKKLLASIAAVVMLITGVMAAGCSEEIPEGSFYTLQEAYESGWLTVEDLETIADYQNKRIVGEAPISPFGEMDVDTEKTIKRDYAIKWDRKIDGVHIEHYYGTYRGCVAVMFSGLALDVMGDETVGGVTIQYGNSKRIEVWKANV